MISSETVQVLLCSDAQELWLASLMTSDATQWGGAPWGTSCASSVLHALKHERIGAHFHAAVQA